MTSDRRDFHGLRPLLVFVAVAVLLATSAQPVFAVNGRYLNGWVPGPGFPPECADYNQFSGNQPWSSTHFSNIAKVSANGGTCNQFNTRPVGWLRMWYVNWRNNVVCAESNGWVANTVQTANFTKVVACTVTITGASAHYSYWLSSANRWRSVLDVKCVAPCN